MFYTGLALWVPTSEIPFFAAGTSLVGGIMSMRIIHYFMMFVFICFMFIHIYLPTLRVSLLRCSCSSIRSMAVWSTIPISTTSSARMTWVTASSTSF